MSEQAPKEIVIVEGQLKKIIHKEGEGQLPKKGQQVFALYKGTLQNGTVFDSNEDPDSPFKFTIGQGMVIKGWDQGFASMKKGEKATLICEPEYAYGARGSPPKIPPNSTLNFEVILLDFQDKKKEKWDMSAQQKVEEATNAKKKGNDFLKKEQYIQAIKAYKEGIDFVDYEDNEKAKEALKLLRLNISQAYLKNKEYESCIEHASKVLEVDNNNPKALYRRGMAYSKSQEYEQARTDFQELLKVDPENNEAKKEILNIAEAIKKFKQKQKKVFGGMFSGGLYDDKKIEPPKPKSGSDEDEPEGEPIPSDPEDEKEQETQPQKPAQETK